MPGPASVPLEPGDLLLFYSDGLIEARNPDGEIYGIRRLGRFLADNHEVEPGELLNRVYMELVKFSNSVSFVDDLTCIAVRISEPDESHLVTHAKIEIFSSLAELERLRLFLQDGCDKAHAIDKEHVMKLELALNEVASNVIRHSYQGRSGQKIQAELDVYPKRIVVRLYHCGLPFTKPQVSSPAFDGTQQHGFGLYLIRNCVDEIHYATEPDGRNCIRLTKRI